MSDGESLPLACAHASPVQAIATITKFLLDHSLADKPVFLAGASSGGTLALKLPATLYLAAKSAGALSLEQASAMAEAYNGSTASVADLAGALAAAASAGSMLGVGEGAAGQVNATAAPFYLQVHGIITGELGAVGVGTRGLHLGALPGPARVQQGEGRERTGRVHRTGSKRALCSRQAQPFGPLPPPCPAPQRCPPPPTLALPTAWAACAGPTTRPLLS